MAQVKDTMKSYREGEGLRDEHSTCMALAALASPREVDGECSWGPQPMATLRKRSEMDGNDGERGVENLDLAPHQGQSGRADSGTKRRQQCGYRAGPPGLGNSKTRSSGAQPFLGRAKVAVAPRSATQQINAYASVDVYIISEKCAYNYTHIFKKSATN